MIGFAPWCDPSLRRDHHNTLAIALWFPPPWALNIAEPRAASWPYSVSGVKHTGIDPTLREPQSMRQSAVDAPDLPGPQSRWTDASH